MDTRLGWTVRGARGSTRLTLGGPAPSADDSLPPETAVARLDEWFPPGLSAVIARGQLVEIARALRVTVTTESARNPMVFLRLRTTVRDALRDGSLRAQRLRGPGPAAAPAPVEEAPFGESHLPPVARDTDTWIAIHLVDDGTPPQAVPYARYHIELPDGTVREGSLDRMGLARIDGIHPGMCEVTFPDYDRRAPTPFHLRPAVPPAPLHRAEHHDRPPPARPRAVDGPARCRVTELEVTDSTLTNREDLGPGRLLQVVPMPEAVNRASLKLGKGFHPEFIEKFKESKEFYKEWARSKNFAEFVTDQQKKAAAKGSKPAEFERSVTPSVAVLTGGSALLRTRVFSEPACGDPHTVRVTGARASTHQGPEATVRLAYDQSATGADARPSEYVIEAQGCDGPPGTVHVQVFPSRLRVISGSLEFSRERWSGFLSQAESLAKRLGLKSIEMSLEGSISWLTGWRADEDSWRAFYANEGAIKGAVKFSTSGFVSLALLVFKVPPAISEYIADVRVGLTLEFGVEVGLTASGRRFPGGGGEHPKEEMVYTGEVAPRGALTPDVHAHLGARKIFAVEVSGQFTVAIKGSGKVERDDEGWSASASVVLEQCRPSLSVVGTALFYERRKDWTFDWWDEHRIVPPEPGRDAQGHRLPDPHPGGYKVTFWRTEDAHGGAHEGAHEGAH